MDEGRLTEVLGMVNPALLENHIAERDLEMVKKYVRKMKKAHRWPWITCLAAGGTLVAAGGAFLARYLVILRRANRRVA